MVNVVNKPQKDSYCTQYCWPFPTKDNPLKPWTPKEVKAYTKLQREKAKESPL